jgi:hypothetical protein
VEDLAKHLALLSLVDHKHLSYWPSTVAASVVALACLATNKETSCKMVMEVNTEFLSQSCTAPLCLLPFRMLIVTRTRND